MDLDAWQVHDRITYEPQEQCDLFTLHISVSIRSEDKYALI